MSAKKETRLLIVIFSIVGVLMICSAIFLITVIPKVYTNLQKYFSVSSSSNYFDNIGGVRITLNVKENGRGKPTKRELESAKVIIGYRLKSLGLTNSISVNEELGQISIEILSDNRQESSDLKAKVNESIKRGLLTFQEVDEDRKNSNGLYLPTGKVIIDGIQVLDVQLMSAKENGNEILLKLNSQGSQKFEEVTGELIGKHIGIFMDDNLISAPKVVDKIKGGNLVITGVQSIEDAKNLVIIIRSGSLPIDLEIVEYSEIKPKT